MISAQKLSPGNITARAEAGEPGDEANYGVTVKLTLAEVCPPWFM